MYLGRDRFAEPCNYDDHISDLIAEHDGERALETIADLEFGDPENTSTSYCFTPFYHPRGDSVCLTVARWREPTNGDLPTADAAHFQLELGLDRAQLLALTPDVEDYDIDWYLARCIWHQAFQRHVKLN